MPSTAADDCRPPESFEPLIESVILVVDATTVRDAIPSETPLTLPTRVELGAAAFLAFVGVPALIACIAGVGLFERPFWSDEVLSWLIASDPSFSHGMAALAGGVDTNAPLLHALLHLVGNLFGHEPIVYRTLCAAAMSAAMLGLYLTLRRRAPSPIAATACLLLWSLPIVFAHTSEARFYGLELAAAVWTNLEVQRRRAWPTVWNATALAFFSITLCSAHYFGVVALAAIVAAHLIRDLVADGVYGLRRAVDAIFPTAAGVATSFCFWPLIHTQRQTMASVGGTWVPDAFVTNVRCTIESVVSLPNFLALGVIVVLAMRGRRLLATISSQSAWMIATGVYVGAIIAFDRLVQPVIVPRYFIVMLPAAAALAASALMAAPRWTTWATLACALIFLSSEAMNARARLADPTPRSALGILQSVQRAGGDQLALVRGGSPIVSDWLGYALPITRAWPALREQVLYLPDLHNRDPELAQSIPYERRMAECVERFYGVPRQVGVDRLASVDHFVLLTEFAPTVGTRFPQWRAQQVGPITFEMTRRDLHGIDRSAAGSADAN